MFDYEAAGICSNPAVDSPWVDKLRTRGQIDHRTEKAPPPLIRQFFVYYWGCLLEAAHCCAKTTENNSAGIARI